MQSSGSSSQVKPINKHITDHKDFSARMARLYWKTQQLQEPNYIASPRALKSIQDNGSLENPLVVGSIVAGVVGVVIIAVIIFSVWILSKFSTRQKEQQQGKETEYVDADSAMILASISMSTLDIEENNDTQMDTIPLNDTTFYSANVSIPIDGAINSTANFDDSGMTIRPEISLSPV